MSEYEMGHLTPRIEHTVLSLVSHRAQLLPELQTLEAELESLREWTPNDPHVDVVYDEVSVLREELLCIDSHLTHLPV